MSAPGRLNAATQTCRSEPGWAWRVPGPQLDFRSVHVADLDAIGRMRERTRASMDEIVRDGAISIQAASGRRRLMRSTDCSTPAPSRVVFDIAAIEEPSWLAAIADCYPGSVIVATDVRERRVVTRGWVRNVPVDIFDVVEELAGLPLGGLLISVVHGDGSSTSATCRCSRILPRRATSRC